MRSPLIEWVIYKPNLSAFGNGYGDDARFGYGYGYVQNKKTNNVTEQPNGLPACRQAGVTVTEQPY
jgi:hypothetical protein